MGVWRSFKAWMKRTVLRMVMRVVRTRLYNFLRKIARASIVPLSITAGATGVGVGVASAVAFPLVYGGLIGVSLGVAAVILTRVWLRHAEAQRSRRRTLATFSVLSGKEKEPESSSRGIFVPVVASSSSSSRGKRSRSSSRR